VRDAGVGLALCALAMELAAPAGRFAPEPLAFIARVLQAALPPAGAPGSAAAAAAAGAASVARADAFVQLPPGLLHVARPPAGDVPPPRLLDVIAPPPPPSAAAAGKAPAVGAAAAGGDALKLGLLGVALAQLRRVGGLYAELDPFPELIAPALGALAGVGGLRGLPPSLAAAAAALRTSLAAAAAAATRRRRPMVQARRLAAAPPPKEFNPRFEEGFNARKDYDPDRARAEQRSLVRAVAKEKRGALRELRRDGAFLAAERDAERAGVDAERLRSEKAFYSELQGFEADMRSGGQAGMNPHLKDDKAAASAAAAGGRGRGGRGGRGGHGGRGGRSGGGDRGRGRGGGRR